MNQLPASAWLVPNKCHQLSVAWLADGVAPADSRIRQRLHCTHAWLGYRLGAALQLAPGCTVRACRGLCCAQCPVPPAGPRATPTPFPAPHQQTDLPLELVSGHGPTRLHVERHLWLSCSFLPSHHQQRRPFSLQSLSLFDCSRPAPVINLAIRVSIQCLLTWIAWVAWLVVLGKLV